MARGHRAATFLARRFPSAGRAVEQYPDSIASKMDPWSLARPFHLAGDAGEKSARESRRRAGGFAFRGNHEFVSADIPRCRHRAFPSAFDGQNFRRAPSRFAGNRAATSAAPVFTIDGNALPATAPGCPDLRT